MKTIRLLASLVVCGSISLTAQSSFAQGQQNQQGPPGGNNVAVPTTPSPALNPVFNDPGKAWIVRYGGEVANGNKRGDIAVQIRIQADSGSDKNFTGTIYRYDNIKLIGSKVHYKMRSTANGKLTFDGATKGWDPNKPRRPVRFSAERLYQDDNKDIRKLHVYGTYHSGSDVSSANKRKDDRLILTVVDKLITPFNGNGNGNNGNNGNGTNGNGNGNGSPTPATGASSTSTVFIAHFTANLHPCEEEPDVDIMEEAGFEEEPPLP